MPTSALWFARSRGAHSHEPSRIVTESATAVHDYKDAQDQQERLSIYSLPSSHLPLLRLLSQPTEEVKQLPHSTNVNPTVLDLDQKLGELMIESSSADFRSRATSSGDAAQVPQVLVCRLLTLRSPSTASQEELHRWYQREHIPLLTNVPGWQRTRCYKTSAADPGRHDSISRPVYLALDEYSQENGLSMLWHGRIMADLVDTHSTRIYRLESSTRLSPENMTPSPTSNPGFHPPLCLYSHLMTLDGVVLPYRLSGSVNPSAPTILLSNTLLTSWEIWDPFVATFLAKYPQFRVLCYNTRGRSSLPPAPHSTRPQPVTLNVLADDMLALLDALGIVKLHALMGCSIGGASTLVFALRHPSRVARFIAADCAHISSAENAAAWDQRIELARDPSQGIGVLAKITVERWLAPRELTESELSLRRWIAGIIIGNSVQGFSEECKALYDYDLRQQLPGCTVKGMLVVGEKDGIMPGKMEQYRANVGPSPDGVPLKVIKEAGHVPMVEQMEAFLSSVEEFLTVE